MVEGEASYELQRLWKDFGINYQSTDYEDRVALSWVISESFRLEIFEKSNIFLMHSEKNHHLTFENRVRTG